MQIPANDPRIIAPCGINCSLCRAYMRTHNPCPGCRGGIENKSDACLYCAIRNCPELASGKQDYCLTCKQLPCTHLQHLDKRYRTQYGVSVIANLERIGTTGLERFMVEETAKWSCPACGKLLCMHALQCPNCGYTKQIPL